ncbi:transposase [Allobaculum mucilyticum]|uniref:transposase n=1 Tax=Allobaculum mucilyticum TaxID=2834459 RepID=UPI001F602FDB|nr:transposase [Allobaculum mucilyticum]UNT96460.1 transposase [Allobaculum mucilyticum]
MLKPSRVIASLAVDGSEIQVLPEQDNDITYGASKKGKKRHFVHLNAEFDALNSVFTDALLQPGSEKNEDSALLELALSVLHFRKPSSSLIGDTKLLCLSIACRRNMSLCHTYQRRDIIYKHSQVL